MSASCTVDEGEKLESIPNASDASTGSATLDDVARLAGVSTATVSRALNGRSGVKQEVRARVELIAESLGYSPNRAAQRLALGRSSVIALVMPSSQLQLQPYGAAITQSVAAASERRDQGMMLQLASEDPGRGVKRFIHDGQVDGVVVSALAINEAWVRELTASRFPTVLLGWPERSTDAICVDSDNLAGAVEATEHLISNGRVRIAHIAGPAGYPHSADRERGWKLALAEHGLIDAAREQGQFTYTSGREAADRMLQLRPLPDAIFAGSDEMALGAMEAIHRAGLRVPDDIALVGYDGLRGEENRPSLTTVAQPFEEMAATAVDTLLKVIDGEGPESAAERRIIVDGELIVRESSGGT